MPFSSDYLHIWCSLLYFSETESLQVHLGKEADFFNQCTTQFLCLSLHLPILSTSLLSLFTFHPLLSNFSLCSLVVLFFSSCCSPRLHTPTFQITVLENPSHVWVGDLCDHIHTVTEYGCYSCIWFVNTVYTVNTHRLVIYIHFQDSQFFFGWAPAVLVWAEWTTNCLSCHLVWDGHLVDTWWTHMYVLHVFMFGFGDRGLCHLKVLDQMGRTQFLEGHNTIPTLLQHTLTGQWPLY